MPRVTFGESAAETVLDQFGLEVNEAGYIIKDGSLITDGVGEPIKLNEFAGIVELAEHRLSVSEDGIVRTEQGKFVTDQLSEGDCTVEAIVPFETPHGYMSGLLRKRFVTSYEEFCDALDVQTR